MPPFRPLRSHPAVVFMGRHEEVILNAAPLRLPEL
jgi:hypothetical protein